MPIESRRIAFSKAEVLEALQLFCRAQSRSIPPGKNYDVVFLHEPALAVWIKSPEGRKLAAYFEAEIIVGLILLCRQERIPIPRDATKCLEIANDRMVLSLEKHDDHVFV